jgi:hypothetical protein
VFFDVRRQVKRSLEEYEQQQRPERRAERQRAEAAAE